MKYKAKGFFKSGHYQTIYQYIFRKKIKLSFEREVISTYDNDVIALDWHKIGSKSLAIIIPGLESGSIENYILGTVKTFERCGMDSVIINLRGCMVENNQFRAYHSGFIDDIFQIVEKMENQYFEIYLVGYSLGGNILLNYVGRVSNNISKRIKEVFVISSPFHLESCSKTMEKKSMRIYTKRFINSFYKKNKEKIHLKPDYISNSDIEQMRFMKTFAELDNAFVVKLFGFKNEIDYWSQTSACEYFEYISVPTTIINAKDDPFLSEFVINYKMENPNITYIVTEDGGHCGFIQKGKENIYFHEKLIEYRIKK